MKLWILNRLVAMENELPPLGLHAEWVKTFPPFGTPEAEARRCKVLDGERPYYGDHICGLSAGHDGPHESTDSYETDQDFIVRLDKFVVPE